MRQMDQKKNRTSPRKTPPEPSRSLRFQAAGLPSSRPEPPRRYAAPGLRYRRFRWAGARKGGGAADSKLPSDFRPDPETRTPRGRSRAATAPPGSTRAGTPSARSRTGSHPPRPASDRPARSARAKPPRRPASPTEGPSRAPSSAGLLVRHVLILGRIRLQRHVLREILQSVSGIRQIWPKM